MQTSRWKKPFRWRSRNIGDDEAADKPGGPQLSNTACASPPTISPLPERPKTQPVTDKSASVTPPTILPAASAQTPLLSTTSASHDTDRSRDGSLSGAAAAKKDYWQIAVDKLQEEDSSVADQIAGVRQAAVAAGNKDFVLQLLEAAKQGQKALEDKRWKFTMGSREVVLRDQFDRLVKVVTSIMDVASAAASLDPLHAGLPLAGFCVLMQVPTNDSDQYAAMVAGVEEIVTIVARYKQIEALYLLRPETVLKQEFERNLVSMYKHIVHYQISATCYYQRNTMLRFLRALPRFDDVSEVIATIRRDDAACRSIGQVFDSSDALERYQELLSRLDRFEEHLLAQKDPGLLPMTGHVHWTVARSANTLFTGRESVLREMESIVRDAVKDQSPREQCRIVITGMGGQGKSEICLQLAHRVRQIFWGVFWIDVSTAVLAESAFFDIASRLQIPAQTWEDVRQGLANVQQPWLLVLDNADDPHTDYQQYIPAGPSGVVILTSRNDECIQYATSKSISLDGLPKAEARELLLRAARVPRDQQPKLQDDAETVASLLRSHPLAIIQAGSYVSRGHCTLVKYPTVFAQQRQRLLAFRPAQAQSRYRDVYATFEASAEILQSSPTEAAADALQLLSVLATCSPSQLPLPLFEAGWKGAQTVILNDAGDDDNISLTSWHVSHLPPLMQPDSETWDSFRLFEAIYLLKALALVSTDTHGGFSNVSMHPLIHAWARDRQEVAELHESWVTTGCIAAISRSDKTLWRRHGRQLQPHLQTLISWEISKIFESEPPIKITSILVNCGWLLYDMRNDAKLFILMKSLCRHLSLDWRTVDKEWLEVYDLTAWNLVYYGKVKEAVSLLEQVVKIQEQTLAEDHPSRLASQHALARAYQANGQVKEAVSLLEQVVKIQEQTLAEDHPSRLASQHALAGAYQANGQVKEAVSLLEQVVKIEEQTLAEDHPSRLASQHALARAYQANGQVKEAVSLLEQVVKIEEQTLAEDHPSRLASQHALAGAYQANGQVKEAVSLLEQVVKIKEQTLAEDHPSRLASQHALAGAYQANGQVKEAVSLLEQVVKIEEQTLAEDHPDRLASQHNLSIMYWDLGRRIASFQMMKHVVEIRRQVLDEHHPSRIASVTWLQDFEDEMRNSDAE